VTLYHWDLPLSLQTDEFPGWVDERIRGKFVEYASLCFREFGSKVASCLTFTGTSLHCAIILLYCKSTQLSEPRVFVFYGYGDGTSPPSLKGFAYVAAKNVILSHALVVKCFRQTKTEKLIREGLLYFRILFHHRLTE
jgi:beta-glucosidase/6-phospho-beta-glucosidase/beta-galactosidase